MINRLSVFLLVAWGMDLFATIPGVITGRVYDLQTLEPLPSASVVYGKGKGTVTDLDGYYNISTEEGLLKLTFYYIGYRAVSHSVKALAGDTVFLNVGLEYEISEIDQIVISAGKVEQRVAELTVSLSVIPSSSLTKSHIADAAELMNKTPGIEVLDGQASIRGGSGFSYGAGSRVLALIDGLPVLAADAGNIKWQFLPLENISQIEVIKGASSVLYGSSALNGIIHFRTAEAGEVPATKFYLEGGVFDKPRNKDWVWWSSPRGFYSASFSHLQKTGNTGIGVGLYILSDNGYRKYNEEKLGRLNFRLKRDSKKLAGLSYGATLNAGLTHKTDFVLWENGWNGALKQDSSTANHLKGHLVTIDPFIRLEKDKRYRHDLRTRIQSSENRFPEGGQNNSRAISYLAEYQSRYFILPWMEMNFGAMENYSMIQSAFYGDHHALNLAAYLQPEFNPVERMKIVAGVRVEHNSMNGVNDKPISLFRAGINYRLMGYTFLRGSFGQGYRFPSIAEKYAATTLGSVRIVPNPYVLPESGYSAEIGVKQGISKGGVNGFIDLAAFYTRNTDMIEYLFGIYPVPGGESFSYGFMANNVENSKVYGMEFSFSLNKKFGMSKHSLGGGYTFMFPVEFNPFSGNNSSTYLKYRRKHSLKLNYGCGINKFNFGFDLSTGSRILNIDKVFLDELTRENILPGFYDYWQNSNNGYLIVNPNISYSIQKHIRLSLVLKNAFNGEYMGRPGDIMPQRQFSVRFGGEF